MLVISLFDGLGACRVALDVIGAKIAGYIAVEKGPHARRSLESNFPSVEFVHDVEEVSDCIVRSFANRFSRASLVLIAGGPPCQGVSGLNASRLGSELDFRSRLHHEVPRIRELVQKYFCWCETFVLMESVSSMSENDRVAMSKAIGILPYDSDASGITPCHRRRFYWYDWAAHAEENVQIQSPLTCHPSDHGRITFLLDCSPSDLIEPGWSLAGGSDHKLPTFTTAQPKAQPGFMPAGIEGCSSRDLEYWKFDSSKFPAYQYKFHNGLLHPKRGWRIPNVNEREVMLGLPLDYTHQCWSKGDRKRNPQSWEDCRLTLLGNSWSIPVVAFLLRIFCILAICVMM